MTHNISLPQGVKYGSVSKVNIDVKLAKRKRKSLMILILSIVEMCKVTKLERLRKRILQLH